MTDNKELINRLEVIEREAAEIKRKLAEPPVHPFEPWVPDKAVTEAYLVSSAYVGSATKIDPRMADWSVEIAHGLVFETKEQAEFEIKRHKLMYKLRPLLLEKFPKNGVACYLYFSTNRNALDIGRDSLRAGTLLFKSHNAAQYAIDNYSKEILEVFFNYEN